MTAGPQATAEALHPQLRRMLDRAAALPPFESLSPQEVRAGDLARYARVPLPEVGSVEDRWIDGPRGRLRVRIYRPPDADEARPVVVFFHGSGFVICSVETHDGLCRQLCLAAGAVVVSVDYALAPEQKFPAAPDDCLAATEWVLREAAGFGGDPARVALAGDSAGGALAAVTALRLRDMAAPVRPLAMLLMYPVADHPNPEPASYAERGEGYGLGAATMRWFWAHYLADPAQGADPRASPLRARDLGGLPPAYVMVAEYDPLRDEGLALAGRLANAGEPTVVRLYDDMAHGFMSWVGLLNRADEALADAAAWLRERLGAPHTSTAAAAAPPEPA